MQKKQVKELVIHIGIHKTGSTSIQNALFNKDNSHILKAHSIEYLESLGENHSYAIIKLLSLDNLKNIENYFKINRFPKSVSKLFRYKYGDVLIISGEEISQLDDKQLFFLKKLVYKFIQPKKIKIVCYMRYPLSFMISALQEMIKSGQINLYKDSFLNDLKSQLSASNYQKIYERIVNIFGEDYIEIRSFEKAIKHKFGIVGDFLHILGVNNKALSEITVAHLNSGLSNLGLRLFCFINRNSLLIKKITKCDEGIKIIAKIPGDGLILPEHIINYLIQNTERDVNWLYSKHDIDYRDLDPGAYISKHGMDVSLEQVDYIIQNFDKLSNGVAQEVLLFFRIQIRSDIDYKLPNTRKMLFLLSASKLKSFREKLEKSNDPAEFFREIAVYLEQVSSLNEALHFMKIAKLFRESGPFINAKIDFYERELSQDKFNAIGKL
jgi:hypothetical protein